MKAGRSDSGHLKNFWPHIATRPRERAKLSAERLLQADSSSPKAHFYLAESARQDAGFEETLHHLSSLLFARGRERGLSRIAFGEALC